MDEPLDRQARRPTKAVYQIDETLRTHLTQVVLASPYKDLLEHEQALFSAAVAGHQDTHLCHIVVTKETIFYAQGGGQPCDIGTITARVGEKDTQFNVEAVRLNTQGEILHFGTYNVPSDDAFEAGEMVEQRLDGSRRDLNSRNHTAGHIVALAVRRLAETESQLEVIDTKASHYPGACWVEFKGLIDSRFKNAIQDVASDFVKQAMPIKLYWYRPDELQDKNVITTEGMPILTGADGMVRVVDVEGAGAYPCGGTHVQDSSLVGALHVRSIKRQRGISKVSYNIS